VTGGERSDKSDKLKHREPPSRRRPWPPWTAVIGYVSQTHKHITAVHLASCKCC